MFFSGHRSESFPSRRLLQIIFCYQPCLQKQRSQRYWPLHLSTSSGVPTVLHPFQYRRDSRAVRKAGGERGKPEKDRESQTSLPLPEPQPQRKSSSRTEGHLPSIHRLTVLLGEETKAPLQGPLLITHSNPNSGQGTAP